uniref:Sperm surface protein Sp17 n=1 Tax=Gopherus evgoodei TaxID=1825980 RepID=A0A8C4YT73_9SAUR
MSIPFSNTHHRIPPGFANLLEGLARKVLREQPEDIPAFAANYFEELLDKREKTKFDPAEWGAKLDNRFYNNKAFEEAVSLQEEVKESMKDSSMEPVSNLPKSAWILTLLELHFVSMSRWLSR